MSENDPFVAATAEGERQAYERLAELEVQSAGVPWGDQPGMSASALAQLQKEGATATLDAYERLSDSASEETLVDVARSLAAAGHVPLSGGISQHRAGQLF